MSQRIVRAIAGLVIAVGAWCSAGTLAIVDGAVIAGLLPPLWLLAAFAALGVTCVARMRFLPLSTAFLPAVAIVPWLGSARFPATLLWTGPLAVILWALFVVAVARAWGQDPAQKVHGHVAKTATGPAPVAAAAALTIAAFAAGALRGGITGDEPHYLVTSQSILLDGDLDLANDYDVARHRAMYPAPLEPHHTVLAPSGHEYSFHGIGVAALALPGFAVGGLQGAQTLFALFAIAGAIVFWSAAREVAGTAAAWAASAALVLQFPFLGQAAAIYPDGPAAAITSYALLTLLREERGPRVSLPQLMACAGALSILPWLHLRLTFIAAVFATALVVAMRRRGRTGADIITFLAVPLIAAALFVASTYVMFETFDPTAVFRGKASGSIAAIPTGVIGLLVDHEYGLLVYAPICALSMVGWRYLRQIAPVAAVAAALAALGTLLIGAAFVWWGGTTSPARFLVPVLPALVLGIAAWWPRAAPRARNVMLALVAYSAAVAALAARADQGRYVTTDPDGRLSIFEWANQVVDLPSALPSLFRANTTPVTELLIACVWIAMAIAVMRFARRLPPAWAVVLWMTLATGTTWMLRATDPVTPERSQYALLHARSMFSPTPWMNRRPARSVDRVFPALSFEGAIANAPAGRYLAEATANSPSVSIAIGRDDAAFASLSSNGPRTFALPVAVEHLRITGGRLRPLALSPQRDGVRANYAVRSGDAVLFVFDTPRPDEGGLWVLAERPVAVVCVQQDGETPCAGLQLQAAAHTTIVGLSQGASMQQLQIDPYARAEAKLMAGSEPVLITATGPPARTRAVFVTAALSSRRRAPQ